MFCFYSLINDIKYNRVEMTPNGQVVQCSEGKYS